VEEVVDGVAGSTGPGSMTAGLSRCPAGGFYAVLADAAGHHDRQPAGLVADALKGTPAGVRGHLVEEQGDAPGTQQVADGVLAVLARLQVGVIAAMRPVVTIGR
jgi:hypothetical protein